MINEELVRLGWALAKLYPPNDRHWARMQHAQREAEERGAGLWALCRWGSPVHPIRAVKPEVTSCDHNYGGCVPVYPPDVDCSRVDGPVAVLGDDPHNLNGDGDRRACEPVPQ